MHKLINLVVLGLAAVGSKTVYDSYQEKKSIDALDATIADLDAKITARAASSN